MSSKLKCILCVEDEPEMIDLMRLILGRRGFEVKGASGGVEGLKMIREEKPDLVLLDLMMPDMDGWEVYQQMKADEKTKGIPVIAYGAFINDIVNFVIIAFVIFLVVKMVNRRRKAEDATVKDCPHCLTAIPLAATRCSGCCADLQAA